MAVRAIFLTFFLLAPLAHAAETPVMAHRHIAATANPLATQAALAALRDGGSAIDAAIAGQMVLAVVEPQSSGLGGGSLLMVWDAKTHALSFTEGLASAPAIMPEDYAHGPGGTPIDPKALERAGRVVAVPGTLRTLAALHATHGRLPWERLFRDAIAAAENGFALPRYLRATLMERRELAAKPDFAGYFTPDGVPLPVGAPLRNAALAATFRRIAHEGPDALHTGPIAADIAAAVAQGPYPGTLTVADLAAYRPRQREPVCLVVFDHRVCSAAPPASGGVALLQQLGLAERAGIAAHPPGSLEAAHLFIEAARLSEADRRAFMGDPDQVLVPTDGLLDAAYLDARAREISPDAAQAVVRAGRPMPRHAALPESDPLAMPATTHLSIVDDDGNAVSFTTTINLNFGADLLVDGLVLNDALTNFATTPVVGGIRVANAAAPNKRAITTMAPTIVFGRDGMPELIVGAGGGARIIDSVAETIIGVLAWHLNVRDAIQLPRMGGQNRAQELERNTPAEALAEKLTAMGHAIRIVAMNAGVQAVAITPEGLQGWGDPRRDGVAMGD